MSMLSYAWDSDLKELQATLLLAVASQHPLHLRAAAGSARHGRRWRRSAGMAQHRGPMRLPQPNPTHFASGFRKQTISESSCCCSTCLGSRCHCCIQPLGCTCYDTHTHMIAVNVANRSLIMRRSMASQRCCFPFYNNCILLHGEDFVVLADQPDMARAVVIRMCNSPTRSLDSR